jgi:hypothetical protein
MGLMMMAESHREWHRGPWGSLGINGASQGRLSFAAPYKKE